MDDALKRQRVGLACFAHSSLLVGAFFLPLSAPVISFSWGNSPLVCPGSLGYSFFPGNIIWRKTTPLPQ